MKTKLLFLFLTTCSLAKADENLENATKLQGTTLCVVIQDENHPTYQKLKAAVEKFWDFNKYQFIKKEKISTYINNPKYSVLTFIGMTHEATSNASKPNLSISTFDLADNINRFAGWGLYVLLGDPNNKYQFRPKSGTSFPVADIHPVTSYVFGEDKWEKGSFDYLVVHALRATLHDLKSDAKNLKIQENGVRGTIEKEKKAIFYNDGKIKIDRILYVEKEMAGTGTEAKYAEALGITAEQVKIVSRDEIAKAVENSEDVNYTMKLNPGGPLIYSAKDARPIARLK